MRTPAENHPLYKEMLRLRTEEKWTLVRIGVAFGYSRERVRQIIGNFGHQRTAWDIVDKKIFDILRLWTEGKLFTQIEKELGIPRGYVVKLGLPRNYVPFKHGLPGSYNVCHCDVCKTVGRDRMKAYYHGLRDKGLCIGCREKSKTWRCEKCEAKVRDKRLAKKTQHVLPNIQS